MKTKITACALLFLMLLSAPQKITAQDTPENKDSLTIVTASEFTEIFSKLISHYYGLECRPNETHPEEPDTTEHVFRASSPISMLIVRSQDKTLGLQISNASITVDSTGTLISLRIYTDDLSLVYHFDPENSISDEAYEVLRPYVFKAKQALKAILVKNKI
ncbi:MAG: hypothetical protein RL641_169 [Candidatus Parcubacteria bacterium]|jgi:hypothetical protein